MFKKLFQSKLFTILYSVGSNPLQLWAQQARNGHIEKVTDEDIQSRVMEVKGVNVSTTFITCPADPKVDLGIKHPFLVMIIKNLANDFTFEVEVLDNKKLRRRFRASTYHSSTQVNLFSCTMPIRLDKGWNVIQFNLSDFTMRAYGTEYKETLRVQLHANCRIRRVYFSDKIYAVEDLPTEYKLQEPVEHPDGKGKSGKAGKSAKSAAAAAAAAATAAAAPAEPAAEPAADGTAEEAA